MQSLDKNSIIGFILIGILLVVFSIYNSPSEDEIKKRNKTADSIAQVKQKEQLELSKNDSAVIKNDSLTKTETPLTDSTLQTPARYYTLENDKIKVTVSSKGAAVTEVLLKDYKTWDKKPLRLFQEENNQFAYVFIAGSKEWNSSALSFTADRESLQVKGADSSSITFTHTTPDNKEISITYSLRGDRYLFNKKLAVKGQVNDLQRILQIWNCSLNNVEKAKDNEITNSSIYFRYTNDEVDHISEGTSEEKNIPVAVDWLSFKQQYFNSTIITKNGYESGNIKIKDQDKTGVLKAYESEFTLNYKPYTNAEFNFDLYYGPNSYYGLKDFDIELENIIPLGWGIFGWFSRPVNRWFIIPVFNFFNDYIGSYGIIILIMTILLKIILFPLTQRSLLSAAKMRVLKPEIDELKEKYADDQTRFGQEQLKLFQKAGVNPLGGCIPMLLQMPILIAMYSFFPVSIELRQQAFLWAQDLSTYDSILDFNFDIPFYGNHVSLFTLLMTVSSILFAIYNNQLTGVSGQMKYMAYIFPVMLLGIFNNLSSGLTYYYFLSNVISFGQQWIIQRFFIDEDAIHKQIQENKKKTPKKSGFMARLEEMQKQQQQQLKNRKK